VLHLRVHTTPERVDAVLDVLRASPGAHHIAHLPGAGVEPPGDLILCDLAREGANHVIRELRVLGLCDDGAIVVEDVIFSISDAAANAERDAPGLAGDAVVWEEVEARMRDEGALTASFLVFMAIAVMIAGIGILLDQPILIVGAMVVGPDFSPLAALSFWLFRRRPRRAANALRTLLAGLGAGIAVAALAGFAARGLDLAPASLDDLTLPLTGFVFEPDLLSFVVAVLAGVVGMLSFTEAKVGALVGVLISVTTVPAAAGVGIAVASGEWGDALGAAIQLSVNLVGLAVACVATLWAQFRIWRRHPTTGYERPGDRAFG
jgi:uncharacterized hydrophobic protein (TIGR00271 family)